MRVFNNKKFVALCYLTLIKPGCIAAIPSLRLVDTLFDMLRIILILYILLMFFKNLRVRKNRLLTVTAWIILSLLWEIISTYINGKRVTDWGVILNSLGIVLFTYEAISNNYSVYIESTALAIGSYVIINCLTVLLFPNGMYSTEVYTTNYFLSYRTAWFAVYLLALTTALLWHEQEKKKLTRRWLVAVALAAYISMLRVWTATGLLCFTLGAIFMLVLHFKKKKVNVGILSVMIAEAAVFYMIVIARMQEKFSFIIVNMLNKDITLTARTRIWDIALKIIKDHLLFGVGRLDADSMRSLLGYGASHPHCRYLFVTMSGGIIGLFIFLYIIYVSAHGKLESASTKNKQIIILAAFIAMLTAAQVESFSATGAYLYPIFMMAAMLHCPSIIERSKDV